MTGTWINDLVSAVNADNTRPDTPCPQSATAQMLSRASVDLHVHTRLADADFANAGRAPLEQLRSDVVACQFSVITGETPNVLVARMTVPGGPWPGHYGLEALAFTATSVRFPAWFPPCSTSSPIHFGALLAASNGFVRGQGAVLFPELLSVRNPRRGQAFGVVFSDRLTDLYRERVVPVLASSDGIRRVTDLRAARELAFTAHEWGHLLGTADYEATVVARRQRAIAVVSELHADLNALAMLIDVGTDDALDAAEVLLFDRIIREAWLPRAHAQVDGIVGRQLLNLLAGTDVLCDGRSGPRFEMDQVWPRLAAERRAVRDVEMQCVDGNVDPAQRYLADAGWHVDERGAYWLQRSGEVSARVDRLSRDHLQRL